MPSRARSEKAVAQVVQRLTTVVCAAHLKPGPAEANPLGAADSIKRLLVPSARHDVQLLCPAVEHDTQFVTVDHAWPGGMSQLHRYSVSRC